MGLPHETALRVCLLATRLARHMDVPEHAALGGVIVYDRRGCSRSERPDPYGSTSPGEQAADA